MKVIFPIFSFFLLFSCNDSMDTNQPRPNSSIPAESFLLYKDFPSELVTPRNVEVWLPENYSQIDSLSVLYMFDGQNLFHPTKGWNGGFNPGWQVQDVLNQLVKEKKIRDVMVVGIFSIFNKRWSEYMPAQPYALVEERVANTTHEWYKSFRDIPIESDLQLKFIVEELKPFIDQQFKTKKDRTNTFVAGSSMGGLISAYAICEYPEVFGGAACFSTHWPPLEGVFLEYLKDNLPDPATHRIYFDFGTEGLDAEYEPFQKIADAAMLAKGYEANINWKTQKFEGAKHHEEDWHQRFDIPMQFLLEKE